MITKIIQSPSQRFVWVCLIVLIVMGVRVFVQERYITTKVNIEDYVEFTGVVDREEVVRGNQQELIVRDGEDVTQVKLFAYPQYKYGNYIRVWCSRSRPESYYGRYLRMQGIGYICDNSEVELVEQDGGFLFKKILYTVRRKTSEQINRIWPEPHAALVAGILYGARVNMPMQLKEEFSIVGLTHIMAVSGYNVTIIANVIMHLLRGVGVRRKRAFWFVFVAVVLFVIFVGSSASAVRAGIMGIVGLLGRTLGRGGSAAPLLVLAALLMTLHNPMVLLYDAGFHLSMLATIGLIYGSHRVELVLWWVTDRFELRQIIATTISAIAATAPYISWSFGSVSIISLFANVVILPVIPLLMMSSAVAVGAGVLSVSLGLLIGSVAWIISSYVTAIVHLLAQLPFANVQFSISFWMMIVMYVGLWLLLQKKLSQSVAP